MGESMCARVSVCACECAHVDAHVFSQPAAPFVPRASPPAACAAGQPAPRAMTVEELLSLGPCVGAGGGIQPFTQSTGGQLERTAVVASLTSLFLLCPCVCSLGRDIPGR